MNTYTNLDPAQIDPQFIEEHQPSALFLTVLESMREGLLITDPRRPDNPIVFSNTAFRDLTGYDFSEIIGRNCRFLQGEDTDPSAVTQMRDAIAAKKPVRVEVLNHTKQGQLFWNELSIAPVLDDQGEAVLFIGIQHDITAAKRLATAQEDFTRLLTHQLGTPLSVIRYSAELLAERGALAADETGQELLGFIHKSTKRLTNTIDDIKYFHQIESGRYEVKREPVDLGALAQEAVLDLSLLAEERKVALQLQAPAEVTVAGDRQLLYHLVLNLVENAIYYSAKSNPGQVTVTVQAGESGTQLVVADNGIGIPAAEQKQVFAKNYRAGNARAQRENGDGLGLYFIDLVSRLHGADLALESTEGEGTTFTVTFAA
jgi:PAS domain S-box-containing protein